MELIAEAIEKSRRSARRRVILPLHPTDADSLHRMLNAAQPGTYVRPHRHLWPPKAETIVVLRGSIGYLAFDEAGRVRSQFVLSAGSERFGIDTKPGVYHTFVALEADTVLFEVKPGPYDEKTDKDFARWAPEEKSEQAGEYLAGLMGRFRA